VASAQVTIHAPGDAVADHPGLTYLDLLRKVVPDIAMDADGSAAGGAPIPFRHLADPTCPCDPPLVTVIGAIDALPLVSERRERLLLLAHVSDEGWYVGGTALLMLFGLDRDPILLDVADVALDGSVRFAGRPLLDLSPADQAALVESAHWNSNQTYLSTLMVFAPDGRLALIDDVFTFSERACGYERVQSPSFEARSDPARTYADIRVRVRAETARTEDTDCGEPLPRPESKTVEATYRWDAASARFMPDSDALDRFAAESEQRF
jgi:hypothetical protein